MEAKNKLCVIVTVSLIEYTNRSVRSEIGVQFISVSET